MANRALARRYGRAVHTDSPPAADSRAPAVLGAVAAVSLSLGMLWLLGRVVPGWTAAERRLLGAPFATSVLAFLALPLLLVAAARRRPAELGITFDQPRRWVEAGCMALAVLGPVSGLLFPLVMALRLDPRGIPGGLVMAAGLLAALPLVGLVLRKTSAVEERPDPGRGQYLAVAAVFVVAATVGVGAHERLPVVASVAYVLVFVGIGEELLFRGLVQGGLDRAFGRPWRWFGADVGPGLLISAALFGVAHLLSPTGPGQWGWFAWTAVMGLVFGWLRARTGSIAAPALVHGVLDAVGAL